MARVTVTFSFDIEDEMAFIDQADKRCMAEWGSPLEDLVYPKFGQSVSDATLVQAVVETFIASNGARWPEGTADDANLDYSGSVKQ